MPILNYVKKTDGKLNLESKVYHAESIFGQAELNEMFLQLTYIKTFFGFCLSGAVMVLAIKCGVSLCTNLVSFDLTGASNIYKCILITVQSAITPIVISGLVKGSDSVIARMF